MKIINQNQAFQNHKNEHYEMIVNFSTLIFHSQTIVIVLGFGPVVINISVNRLQYIVDSVDSTGFDSIANLSQQFI